MQLGIAPVHQPGQRIGHRVAHPGRQVLAQAQHHQVTARLAAQPGDQFLARGVRGHEILRAQIEAARRHRLAFRGGEHHQPTGAADGLKPGLDRAALGHAQQDQRHRQLLAAADELGLGMDLGDADPVAPGQRRQPRSGLVRDRAEMQHFERDGQDRPRHRRLAEAEGPRGGVAQQQLVMHPLEPHQRAHARLQRDVAEWPHQHVVRPLPQHRRRGLARVAQQHDHRNRRRPSAGFEPLQQRPRRLAIGLCRQEHQVDMGGTRGNQRVGRVAEALDLVVIIRQAALEQGPLRHRSVDDENTSGHLISLFPKAGRERLGATPSGKGNTTEINDSFS